MKKLIQALTNDNRLDDIVRITTDDKYMMELYKEYNIE